MADYDEELRAKGEEADAEPDGQVPGQGVSGRGVGAAHASSVSAATQGADSESKGKRSEKRTNVPYDFIGAICGIFIAYLMGSPSLGAVTPSVLVAVPIAGYVGAKSGQKVDLAYAPQDYSKRAVGILRPAWFSAWAAFIAIAVMWILFPQWIHLVL